MHMAEFRPKLYDQTAVTEYLKRYMDCRREINVARRRLERLEYLAAKDDRYLTGPVMMAIQEDRKRLEDRICTSETVKSEVLSVIESLPPGDERRVLELCYISDLRIAQIADTMAYSQRSVCNIKERAIKMIIDNYGGENNGDSQNENRKDGCKT